MSFITVTGVLTNPSGAVLPNYNILFEAIRTSDTVINNTDVLIVTNSSGGYSFELGYGTYTLKIKSGREARYSTVASNILIYSQALDNNSIQQIILAQDGLADINIELIDQFLQIRADVLLNAQNASTSETNAAASATSASSSAATATTKASEAASSATSASSSATSATASATSASSSAATATTKVTEAAASATTATTKATEAAASATSALASKNAAATSETNAASSASSALASKNAAATSETNAAASAASASTSATSALASKNAAATSETNAAASAAAASTSERQAAIYTASVAGGIVENGGVDLSSGVAPTPRPDGLGGYISTLWKVTVGGTVNAVNYAVGDSIVYSKALGSYYKIDSTDQVSSVNGMSGAVNITSITGNAETATKLATARSISTSGDITWSVSFDGSANVTAAATLATVATPGTYNSVTVDAKGRVISGTNPSILATEEEVVARIEATKAVTPATLNAVVPYSPNINPTLDLDFANQVYRHFEGPDGLVSHPLTPFVTFTRSSIATFFDAMGVMKSAAVDTPRIDYDPLTGECKGLLVEEQRTNLLTYSASMSSSAFGKGALGLGVTPTVRPNYAVAPDGTLTAARVALVAGGVTAGDRSFLQVNIPTDNVQRTLAVYLKSATSQTYTVASHCNGTSISSVVTPFVWTRVFVSGASAVDNTGYVCSVYGGGAVATSASADLLVWGAQLEAGAFPTSYIPTPATFTGRASTATYLDANGVLQTAASGVARSNAYDYDSDGVLRPIGLLLEASATNQLLYSEQFDNAAWVKSNIGVASAPTVTANYAVGPDGQTTADRVVFALNGGTTINDRSELQQNQTTVAGTTYTQSVWLKTTDASTKVLQLSFNGDITKLITVTGTWQRFSNTGVASDTTRGFRLALRGTTGTSDSADLLIWGAQQGVGNYPTSYIPTTSAQVTRAADTSTSAQATRAADNAVISGANFSQWYKQYEGTVFAESINTSTYMVDSVGYSRGLACFSDGSDTNRIRVGIDAGVSLSIRKDGTDQAYQTVGTISIGTKKTSISYKTDSVVSSVDGVLSSVDASAAMPYLTQLEIGKGAYIGGKLSGHLRKLRYYPKALSSTELKTMTA